MGANVRAERRSHRPEPLAAVEPAPVDRDHGGAEDGPTPRSADAGPELEAEVRAAAASFDALPPAIQRWLDQEALHGRGAYTIIAGGQGDGAPPSAPKAL